MNIKRAVCDFGNSSCQQMIDGFYFELPSSIKEIKEKEAKGLFANEVSLQELHRHLVIRIDENGKNRYFKVGEKAKMDLQGNSHINSLHDKTNSDTVLVTWLAGLAYYHARQQPDVTEDTVNIGYFGTLLPVWLLKKSDRFGEKLEAMANRFKASRTFELLTAGQARTLQVKVEQSRCRVEGETARFALKYDLELNCKDDIAKYTDVFTVINDIGGQSQDLCKLPPGLGAPGTVDDFKSVTDQSFLNVLEQFRMDKLMDYFFDVRSLEAFIVAHHETRQFVYKDPVTHTESDLTETIEPVLRDFSEVAMERTLHSFHFSYGQTVQYVHIGGVAQTLRFYMEEYLAKTLGEDVAKQYHSFPNDSRKLNIYASEILAKSELKKQEAALAKKEQT